ncbi:hypothetical protein KTH05_07070 [Acinetobacter lactucae]|uniref:hypothetical protein n=1 Tax=Acinetobacter lactucae TaxID=1785128 RepID=UPI0021CDAFF2|nr:hypothetical protein [Acinetobacter lactucae]MCU4347508.1 hypothetical protein [Acinetobacter lactucae]
MWLASLHYIAIVLIICLTFYFLILDRKSKKANPQFPSLVITVGIAFTFLGVALGLRDFNTDDPTASLSTLVSGIKTAFWGSLTGVAASIVLKIHSLMYLKEQEEERRLDNQIESFYKQHNELVDNSKYLEVINNNLNENNQKLILAVKALSIDLDANNKNNMQNILKAVENSLSGIEQVQRSTQGVIASEISELRVEFVQYAQKQAEQNTEIFIQALESAIAKFNENLTDSLGENFKQLNQSVNRLVEWQTNYSQHVEEQTQKYRDMAIQIQQIKEHFSKFIGHTDIFANVIDQLEVTLESIDNKNHEFNTRIESFYGALDSKIVDIENTRQILDRGFKKVEEQMSYTMQASRKIFDDINNFIEDSHATSLNVQKQTNQEVQILVQQMQTSFEKTQKHLDESLLTIENKLQQTLNQSLITLGQQLGSLSTKFANDYEPITLNLKKILDSFEKGM